MQRWVIHAGDQRLDRIDFSAPKHGGTRNQTSPAMEKRIVEMRQELAKTSALGEWGAQAIHEALTQQSSDEQIPSIRTIGRVLDRQGVLDGKRRIRRPAPPRGWYLPVAAQGHAEVDSFDIVEGLRIKDGPCIEVLNVISLFSGLVESWPVEKCVTAKLTVQCQIAHWRIHGLPAYAQFDNDTIFQGAHQHCDSIGRVVRLCLALGVIPVFATPAEQGFQGNIESYNGRWQAKTWARFQHGSLAQLQVRSQAYVKAVNARRRGPLFDQAPSRKAFPETFSFDPGKPLKGEVIYLRRTNEKGEVGVLGHRFSADPNWQHRLVRAVVDLNENCIQIHALRRKDPTHQPLLSTHPYQFPNRPFRGGSY